MTRDEISAFCVDQLAEKWDAFADKPAATEVHASVVGKKPPAVFVSYASQDVESVERLHSLRRGVKTAARSRE